jgi:DNA polymerase (family 10)
VIGPYHRGVATTLPKNSEVADQFDLLADFLELEGSDQFRPLAYRRAAQVMRETGGSIAQLAVEGRAKELSGIGKTIEEKIVEIVEHGQIDALAKRIESIPAGVIEFMRLPGLGPKTARRIWRELGVSTVDDLRQAAEAEQLRTLAGLGPKTEENVLRALARPTRKIERVPLLGQALPAVRAVVSVLREHPAADQVSEAGSARRLKEQVRDLDIIATARDPAALTDYLTKLTWVREIAAKGNTKAVVVSNDGLRFDLRVVPPDSYGNLLQHFTGSKQHNMALREDAVRRKLSVSEYGVQDTATGEVYTDRSEESLYERLGYAWIPPELRENMGELEAAREGRLPRLVELAEIRGDLHSHSTWSSDGKNTIEEMALEAKRLGRSYLAVTDHSHYLREGRLEAQNRELEAVQERLGRFKLLQGIEVNIRANGEVDVDDETLAGRDWVMASVHSGFDRDLTERVLAAMENPRVHCIGHLTGRKLNRRGPADVDFERVVEKALETSTFLEINAQPDRLDLRDAHARFAGEAGVKIVISSDAHEVGALSNLEFGVAQARRAWLGPEQIVNTRPWRDVKRLLKRV